MTPDFEIFLEKVLNDLGQKMVEEAKENLIFKERRASGNLINSIDYNVSNDGQRWKFQLVVKPPADKYARYTELGRPPGRKPPVSVIKQWIADKKRWGSFPDLNPYAVARNIEKRGYRGKPVFVPLTKKYQKVFVDVISAEGKEAVEQILVEFFKK